MSDPIDNDLPVLDMSQIEDLRGLDDGQGQLLASIADVYLQQAPKQIAELKAHISAGNFPGIAATAHSFKGSSGNLGASRVAAVCKHLEMAGKGQDGSQLAPWLAELEQEFAQARSALQAQLPQA